ncbi:MAG: hypothetical protein JRI68_25015 [Deltaproteobacteria bacterium]|nr:hypothetical protein [Deltaproteobacteria bacterium]
MRLPSSIWLTVASVATLWLGASCHLVGGTEGLFIQEPGSGAGGSSGTGGTGGTASSSTSTGQAGGGGGECVLADCPGDDTQCGRPACINGVCDMDIEITGTACTDDGGQFCDGAGSCVECNNFDDCGGDPCQDNQCVAATCNDNILDGDETGLDCGGSCGACENGLGCIIPSDCLSWFCDNGICQPCSQHIQCVEGESYCDFDTSVCRPSLGHMDKCNHDYECTQDAPFCACWIIVGCICSLIDN